MQYVPTLDGLRIAYSSVGSGPALLELSPLPFCYFQRSWQFPEERRWFERLARSFTLVQHDPRGMGSSISTSSIVRGSWGARKMAAFMSLSLHQRMDRRDAGYDGRPARSTAQSSPAPSACHRIESAPAISSSSTANSAVTSMRTASFT